MADEQLRVPDVAVVDVQMPPQIGAVGTVPSTPVVPAAPNGERAVI